MGKSEIVVQDYLGYHNRLPEDIKQKKNAYRDQSTILIIPCLDKIASKVVQNWLSLMTPMNQKFTRVFMINMEVGKAYSEAIEMIISNPELSTWKYIMTLEHDNMIQPDTLLKLLDDIEGYDAIGALYYTKGVDGKPMCFDKETELLTKEGWKYFKDVTLNDDIATITDSGIMEFHKPSDKQEYHYKGEMIHWKSQRIDHLVTPDHSIYCAKRETLEFKRYTASEVENLSRIQFKRNAEWEGEEQEFFYITNTRKVKMDDWLRVLGYYISEGCCPKRKNKTSNLIDIRQCKRNTYEKIATAVDLLGVQTKRRDGRIQFIDKEIRGILSPLGYAVDKYVPRYIHLLSKRQIKIFLDALWEGDGSHKENKYENYFTNSKKLADDVQELLLRIGLVGVIGNRKYWNNTKKEEVTKYIISSSHSSFFPIMMKKPKREEYNDMVYDVTVPNHTLYVRRNGRPQWSGNCYGDPKIQPVTFAPFQPQPNTVTRCNGLGMGCNLFRLDMFKDKRLPRPLFETVQRVNPNGSAEAFTQDLKFFLEAGKLGYRFACSTNTLSGHYDINQDICW